MGGEIAVKEDPQLWERAKRLACTSADLCVHSARKMQWASRKYKSLGGRYKGKRSPHNSLSRWTRQRWRTSNGEASKGRTRYLPDAAWKKLSPSQRRRTNRAKLEGFRKGRQFVRQPADVATIAARVRRASKYRKP